MNLLRNTRLYLIGGIENFPNGDDWRQKVIQELKPLGITVFDPYHKPFINEIREDETARKNLKIWMENEEYDKVHSHMKHVRSDDLRLCDISDFLIAFIHPKIASWGSAEEIFTSNKMKKPIFVIVEGGKKLTPLWLMGTLPDKYFYNDINEVLDMIKKIDNGDKLIDSDRWRLLKDEYR